MQSPTTEIEVNRVPEITRIAPHQPPVIRIQHDWFVSLATKTSDEFWVSLASPPSSSPSSASVIASPPPQDVQSAISVKARLSTGHGPNHEAEDVPLSFQSSHPGFQVKDHHQGPLRKFVEIAFEDSMTSKFFKPDVTFESDPAQGRKIVSLGLSPSAELAILGAEDGLCTIFETFDGTLRRELKGHYGDVNACGIFPSGEVAYSASSDTMVKIWRIADALCAATIPAASPVLSLDIIERGRNFVAGSRDGKMRLFDCSTQTIICDIADFAADKEARSDKHAVNSVSVQSNSRLVSQSNVPEKDAREFFTENKVVAGVSENGNCKVVDIRSRVQIAHLYYPSAAVNRVLLTSDGDSLLFGAEDGALFSYDLRNLSSPLAVSRAAGSSPISDMKFVASSTPSQQAAWVSTREGRVFQWNYTSTNTNRIVELSGPNFDPVNCLAVHGSLVLTASRDKKIRKYFV